MGEGIRAEIPEEQNVLEMCFSYTVEWEHVFMEEKYMGGSYKMYDKMLTCVS